MFIETVLLLLTDGSTWLVFLAVFLTTLFFKQTTTKRLPPGPAPWPIVGNIPSLARAVAKGENLEVVQGFREKYGDIVRVRMGPTQNVIFLFGHKTIHQVMLERNDELRYRPTNFFVVNYIFNGKGIFFSNGDQHTSLRKFALTALRDFGVGRTSLETTIHTEASHLCSVLEEFKSEPRDLSLILRKAVANIIAGIVYGFRFDYDDPQLETLINDVSTIFRILSFALPENFIPLLRYLPNSTLQNVFDIFKRLEAYARTRITEHRETFDPNQIRDFVDYYIKSEGSDNKYITEENTFRIIIDLFNAGMDSTANSLYWIILHLANNPHVQDKCRQEIMEVAGTSRYVSLSDRPKLIYLQATMNEVLRISSVVPQTAPHTVLRDIEINGFVIPKDSIVFAFLHSLNRDPDVWENPDDFRPERFIDSNGKLNEHSDTFMPFSAGSRSCIGRYLARMEMLLFTGTLLQRFKFHTPEGIKAFSAKIIQSGITGQPEPFEVCVCPL